jgi:adenine phosphoribosyltransferase
MQPKDSSASSCSISKRDRLERIKEALDTIELLALAKQYYTYDNLEKILRLPSTVLSRYVKGHVLPSGRRGRQIRADLIETVKLGAHVADSLKETGLEVIPQMDMNPRLLWFIVQHIVHANAGRRITKVLTASEHGVPLATLVSHRLGVPLIVATPHKRAGIQKYLESAVLSTMPPSTQPYIATMYLPSHALKKNDAVLIITDFLSDGAIQATLKRLVQSAKAATAAVWATVVTADDCEKAAGPIDFFVKTNVSLTSHVEGDEKSPPEPITVPS